jgi:hypothetical protein
MAHIAALQETYPPRCDAHSVLFFEEREALRDCPVDALKRKGLCFAPVYSNLHEQGTWYTRP